MVSSSRWKFSNADPEVLSTASVSQSARQDRRGRTKQIFQTALELRRRVFRTGTSIHHTFNRPLFLSIPHEAPLVVFSADLDPGPSVRDDIDKGFTDVFILVDKVET